MEPVFADLLSCRQECIHNHSCNFEPVLPCSARSQQNFVPMISSNGDIRL